MATTRHDLTLDDLAAAGGRLLHPGDPGWDDAVRLWNGMVTRTPVLVLQPRSTCRACASSPSTPRPPSPTSGRAAGWPTSTGPPSPTAWPPRSASSPRSGWAA
jgi:hypothetical protein